MQIARLREFIVLANCLSFHAASHKLFVSQPSLSNHIADIEDELGIKLFERKPVVKLTLQGKAFYEDAANIVQLYDAALNRIALFRSGVSGQIKVKAALVTATESTQLNKIFSLFVKENPQVEIKTIDGSQGSLFEGLKEGSIDCATMPGSELLPQFFGEESPVFLYPIFKGQCLVWAKKGHPILRNELAKIEDIAQYPYPLPLGSLYDEWEIGISSLFAVGGQTPRFYRRYAESFDDFILSIKDDDIVVWGKNVMSAYHELDSRPIDNLDLYLYAVMRDDHHNEVLDVFRRFIKGYAHELKKTF